MPFPPKLEFPVINGILKLFVFFIKLTVAIAVIMMLLSVWHALDDGSRQAGNVLWRIICAIGHDIWIVGGHFWRQVGSNLDALAKGAEDDAFFNPFRWFIGAPVYVFVAYCETGYWWTDHGTTAEAFAKIAGTLIIFITLLAVGKIDLGSIVSGGHSKPSGGGGGGHH